MKSASDALKRRYTNDASHYNSDESAFPVADARVQWEKVFIIFSAEDAL